MTINDRDRRILIFLIPIVLLVAYFFLILQPKRHDLSAARDQQHQAEAQRDQLVAQATKLESARQSFAADYADVVKLGKAIPATVDSPSLLIQLDTASKGTHIDFGSVSFGTRAPATVTISTASTTQGPAQPNGNAAAGGAPAQTGVGGAAESAGNAVNNGNAASSNVNSASGGTTTTSTTTATATPSSTAPASTSTPSLDAVPLTFTFRGTYFDLADFFHRLKRFVYLANNQTIVRGRLLTIDTLSFAPGGSTTATSGTASGTLTASVGATVYLAPADQGATGGATAAGPAGTTTTTTTTPAGSQTSSVPLAAVGGR